MGLFGESDRAMVEAVSELVFCNPFLPRRIELERAALGDAFVEQPHAWNQLPPPIGDRRNVDALHARCRAVADAARESLLTSKRATPRELALYTDLVLFHLYHDYSDRFQQAIDAVVARGSRLNVSFYPQFAAACEHYLELPGITRPDPVDFAHAFAVCFQLRRAFYHIFSYIIGASAPATRLRCAVWQSIFTADQRRYYRAYYKCLGDITTLIIGPSGTGKELVARAIGLSRYIPFDPPSGKFVEQFTGTFHAMNLSAFSPTLIESELFGHRRGAFTGAVADRAGWLEQCEPLGTVFLDEIGDLDPAIQVKLLRVLQARQFQRLGDTQTRHFLGKIIAATNRDLAAMIEAGEFRTDFYYRLCSDVITTPSLFEQLQDDRSELPTLVRFLVGRIVPAEAVDDLTRDVMRVIDERLGPDYPWPGNVRELEQCIRNVMIRRDYRPAMLQPEAPVGDARRQITADLLEGRLTADELISRYCTLVFSRNRNYQQTARMLGLDRRTVKAKVDPALLEALDLHGAPGSEAAGAPGTSGGSGASGASGGSGGSGGD